MARPSEYNEKMAGKICSELASGKSLRQVCEAENMPARQTVYNWIGENPKFLDQYARVITIRAEIMAEELLEIADNGENDTYKIIDSGGVEIEKVNHDQINRSRLRVDARKWLMSKMYPKKYGERLDLNHSGEIKIPAIVELPAKKKRD